MGKAERAHAILLGLLGPERTYPNLFDAHPPFQIDGNFGGAAGILIPLVGGRLMGGSLDLLAHHFPDSRLRLDPVGRLFGESGFGPVTQAVTGALEGMLFGGCIVGAMLLARRGIAGINTEPSRPQPLPLQR
jgi:hypothetical protein